MPGLGEAVSHQGGEQRVNRAKNRQNQARLHQCAPVVSHNGQDQTEPPLRNGPDSGQALTPAQGNDRDDHQGQQGRGKALGNGFRGQEDHGCSHHPNAQCRRVNAAACGEVLVKLGKGGHDPSPGADAQERPHLQQQNDHSDPGHEARYNGVGHQGDIAP